MVLDDITVRNASEGSSVVHLHIQIKGQEHTEVIKKTTKAYEVVEVDGFTFKRQKKQVEVVTPPENIPGDGIPTTDPQVDEPFSGPSQAAVEPCIEEEVQKVEDRVQTPDEFVAVLLSEAEDLPNWPRAILVEWVMQRAIEYCAQGTPEYCSLLNEEFGKVMKKSCEMGLQSAASVSCQELTQLLLSMPRFLREMVEPHTAVRSKLYSELQELQSVEQAMKDLFSKYSESADALAAGFDVPIPTVGEAGALFSDLSTSCETLMSEHKAIKEKLALEEEALEGYLDKLEVLAEMAEEMCPTLQSKYHQEKFKAFPHVNSPAWLIRSITHAPADVRLAST